MKNKGFTLIELLAVIVILAIIAVIAVPRILNIVEDSKKSAAVSSALGYIDAIEKQIMTNKIKGTNLIADVQDVDVNDFNDENDIKISGNFPTTGNITIVKGKVTEAQICISGYEVEYDGKNAVSTNTKCSTKLLPRYKVTYDANGGEGIMNKTTNRVVANEFTRDKYDFLEWNTAFDGSGTKYTTTSSVTSKLTLYAIWVKHYGIGEAVIYDPNTNQACSAPISSAAETKDGCMKFYVIKDNGVSIDVILDHNTTPKVAYNNTKSYVPYEQASIKGIIDRDTKDWVKGLNPRIISIEEVAAITGNTPWDSNGTAIVGFDSTYSWLINNSGSYGYWTSSHHVSAYCNAWLVHTNYTLTGNSVTDDNYFGARPVITINKSVFN